MKNTKGYTIVLVPEEGGSSILRLHFPARRIKKILIAGITLFSFFLLSSGYTIYHLSQTSKRWQLEEQFTVQQLHLSALSQQIERSQETLDRVQRLDRKLRTILGTSFELDQQTVLGIGGPDGAPQYDYDEILDPERRIQLTKLNFDAQELEIATHEQEMRFYDLKAMVADQASRLASTPSIYPTKGWMTSLFGMRTSPFTGVRKIHEGIDIAARWGSSVISTAEGVVLYAGVKAGYGKIVIIDHGYGINTRYGHLSQVNVTAGQIVHRGDLLGAVGNTGRSTGPHLHYEVRVDGVPVDPQHYILVDTQF